MTESEHPIEALLADLPAPLRATVEAARDSGEWETARKAVVAAARARPGPRHITYGRLLLALDDFDGCRSILERLDASALKDPSARLDLSAELVLEEAATTWWSPVPGRPDQRIPTSRTAVDAVRAAIADAKALEPTSAWTLSQIESFDKAVDWADSSARVGGLVGPMGAAVAGLVLALHGVRHGGGAWLGASLTWLASAPLLVWAGTRPQWQVNAAVVEGRLSLDDAALAALAKAPPHVAPLGLTLRLLVHGVVAPFAVLWRCLDGRKPLPAVVLLGMAVWAFAKAPDVAPAPEVTPIVASSGPIRLGGVEWQLGATTADSAQQVDGVEVSKVVSEGRLTGLVLAAEAAEPPAVELVGWAPRELSVLSPQGSRCRVTLQRFDAASEQASVRTTGCPGEASTRWTVEVQLR